jgi:hypothetical protein
MRTFLLCLMLLSSQCPGLGFAGPAPVPGPPLQTKTLEKSSQPSISAERTEFYKNRFLSLVRVGYPEVTVEEVCNALSLSGFNKVRILRGLIQISLDHPRTFSWIS